MQKMIDYCRAKGTVEMVGDVLPDNRPMLQLAEHLASRSTTTRKRK